MHVSECLLLNKLTDLSQMLSLFIYIYCYIYRKWVFLVDYRSSIMFVPLFFC